MKIMQENDYGEILAYQIKKQKYGLFILLHFESVDTKKMPDFNKWMKLNSHIKHKLG